MPKIESDLYRFLIKLFKPVRNRLVSEYTDKARIELDPKYYEQKSVQDILEYLPRVYSRIDENDETATVGSELLPADVFDIRNITYLKSWESHFLLLCDETKADIEASTGKKFGTLLAKIKQDITNNEFSGNPVLDLVNELEKYFDESLAYKARRIAVTESNRISNQGFVEDSSNDDVVVGYEWVLSADACDLCKAVGIDVEGKPKQVAKGQSFANHLSGEPYYADIRHAPLHPHCRCSVKAVLDIQSTRFSGTVLVDKGEVIDPGTPPKLAKPIVDLDEFEVDTDITFTEPDPVPEPEPDLGREPARTPTVSLENFVLNTRDELRSEVWAYRETPDFKHTDYTTSGPKRKVDSYKSVARKKSQAIKDYAARVDYENMIENQELSDSELAAIDKAVLQEMKQDSWFSNYPTDDSLRGLSQYAVKVHALSDRTKFQKTWYAMEQIRDDVIEILSLHVADRLPMSYTVVPQKGKAKQEKVKMVERAVDQISRAVGKGVKERRIEFNLTSTSKFTTRKAGKGAHFIDAIGEFYIGESVENDASTVAHELGHAIALGRNKLTTSKNPASSGFDYWMASKSGYHAEMAKEVRDKGKKIYLAGTSADPWRTGEVYAELNGKYITYRLQGDLYELPSVLLETFYRNPVAFVNHMSEDAQALLFGFLDGSLRE